jgi:hypothetical protein
MIEHLSRIRHRMGPFRFYALVFALIWLAVLAAVIFPRPTDASVTSSPPPRPDCGQFMQTPGGECTSTPNQFDETVWLEAIVVISETHDGGFKLNLITDLHHDKESCMESSAAVVKETRTQLPDAIIYFDDNPCTEAEVGP